MKKINILLITLSAVALVGCGSNPIKTDHALSGDEIKFLLSGKTFDIENWKGWQLKSYYETAGTLKVHYLTGKIAGDIRSRRWTVENNTICVTKPNGRKNCGKIIPNGDGTYTRLNPDNTIRATLSNGKQGEHL